MIDSSDIREILFRVSKTIIIPSFGNLAKKQISYKNGVDIVTDIDIAVEQELNNQLSKLIKNSNFIGEEIYSKDPSILKYYLSDEYCWTVDPIDGTKNFAKSKERFAVMVALTKNKKIIQSFIFKPMTNDFMYADKSGAYINDKKINLKKETLLENAIGSISTKYWDELTKSKILSIKHIFGEINSYGSIGCEYFDMALGLRDFTLLSRLYPWDHIPGVYIIRKSGGHDCHFDKIEYKFYQNSTNLIVSNSEILSNKILKLIEEK